MTNKSGVKVDGVNDIINKIEQLGLNIEKVSKDALKNGSKIIQQELEKQTPYDNDGTIHMKDHVVVSGVKTDKDTGGKYITIGYPKGIKHRVHFAEFGTINQAPQHFISDVINQTKSDVRNEIIRTLKEVLR